MQKLPLTALLISALSPAYASAAPMARPRAAASSELQRVLAGLCSVSDPLELSAGPRVSLNECVSTIPSRAQWGDAKGENFGTRPYSIAADLARMYSRLGFPAFDVPKAAASISKFCGNFGQTISCVAYAVAQSR